MFKQILQFIGGIREEDLSQQTYSNLFDLLDYLNVQDPLTIDYIIAVAKRS